MKTPLIVSFYTKNTFYEREAKNLTESCQKQALDYAIVGVDNLGSWKANCGFKPQFLLEQFLKHQRPLLWIDADAVVLEPLTYFKTCSADISFRIQDSLEMNHTSRIMSGTVFINQTEAAFDFLNHWAAYQMTHPELTDQEALRDVSYLRFHHLTIKALPKRYCAVAFSNQYTDEKDPAILHYLASRSYRNLIDNGIESLSFFDSVSDELLRESRSPIIYGNETQQDVVKLITESALPPLQGEV